MQEEEKGAASAVPFFRIADTAYRLATYFGTSAELWMNLQTAYELSGVQHTTLQAIRKEVQRQVA